MASSATPMGARPVGSLVSCAYNAKITHYKIANAYATAIFYGDFVKWADGNPNTTIQKDTGTTSLTPIGVFLGVSYTDPTSGYDTNAIQDSSGNDVADLSSTSVTNNSTIQTNDGSASFSISGTLEVRQNLSVSTDTADPDGTGTLSYSWETSDNTTSWSEVGTNSTYTITSQDQGKKIRVKVSYTDNDGFSEEITASEKFIYFNSDGITADGGSGDDLLLSLIHI